MNLIKFYDCIIKNILNNNHRRNMFIHYKILLIFKNKKIIGFGNHKGLPLHTDYFSLTYFYLSLPYFAGKIDEKGDVQKCCE